MSAIVTWTDANSGSLVSLSLDADESEGYANDAAVTSHSVETGSNIADGVRPTPPAFTLSGIVTNSPATVPTTQMGSTTGALGTVPVTVGTQTVQAKAIVYSGPFDRVGAVDALLQGLVAAGTLVSILTALRAIDNAVVTSYKVDRQAATGNAIPVTLTFQVLRIVSTQTVSVPAPRQRRGTPPGQHGGQPAVPASAGASSNTSVLASVFGGGS